MNTELSTGIIEGGASDSNRNSERIDKRYPNNQLIFVGKGNPAPSKYIIIPKDLENEVEDFTNNYLVRGIENIDPELPAEGGSSFLPTKPGVLISVTGGAADFYMQPSKLEQVFNRGMLKAAQNIGAWIVDGGLDAGVMLYVGKAIKETAVVDVPCIGIATHKKVIMNELLLEKGQETVPAEYVANQPNSRQFCALNANHTHFILVDSPVSDWGQEIKFRSEFEKFIRDKYHVPVVLIVVNGGGGTMETVAQGAEKHFAVVVVQGSGRASDAVAAMVKKAQKAGVVHTCNSLLAITDDGVDVTPWHNLIKEAQGKQNLIDTWTGYMNRILQNYEAVTVFNCDDEAASDMDIYILRAILSSPGRKLSLLEKLKLGVVWNRADIVSEILEDSENDGDLTSEDKRTALNSAFELAIQYNRPEIFNILAENGAQKDSVNLKKLYYFKELKSYFKRLPAYAQTRRVSSKELASPSLRLPLPIDINVSDSATEYSKDSAKNRAMLRETFRQIGHAFHGYYAAFEKKFDSNEDIDQRPGTATMHRRNKKLTYKESGVRVSFTDILIWSVFVNRMDLAKVIWQHTTLPVHSALLACQLYRYLANYCSNKEDYQTNADWFEDEAIKMLDIMDYQDVKEVLIWEWSEMGNRSALDIAQTAQCKRFVCHAHVQSLLDDIFYSDQYGKLEPTIPTYRIWAAIIMPLFISLIYKNIDTSPQKAFYMFYRLPIVKFWTNTFLYCAFLFVQAYVLCTLKEGDAFHVTEYILWVWVFSLIIDEISQYVKDPLNHFKYLSNLMDTLVLLLHVVYIILRWVAYAKQDDNNEGPDEKTSIFSGSINTLIVACIFSWARLLNAFAISHNLGPLYFIIIRLFKDIFVWIFVFVIFAVSFQLGFISMTLQLNGDPVEGYPTGTFPVAFFTIIGEYAYSADFLSGTPLGITLLAIYALIAQILLVNLLIAMMGSTYSNVSENSATEWKFFRLELMMENRSASFHPPPTNIIIVPLQIIFGARKIFDNRNGSGDMKPLVAGDDSNVAVKDIAHTNFDLQKILKKMRIAKDEVIETEQQAVATSVIAIVGNVHDRLRTLANERENDRTFLDKKFADLGTTLTVAANQAAASGGGGAVAGLALGKLQDTIQILNSTNQLLVQQNQQILAQLLDLQNRQQQMQGQIASLQAPQSGPSGEGRSRLESSANRMRVQNSRRNTEVDPSSDDIESEGRVVL